MPAKEPPKNSPQYLPYNWRIAYTKTKNDPKKYNKNVMPNRIIELMSLGYSLRACAPFLGVTYKTLNQWKKTYPEMSEAIEIGWEAREAFLEHYALQSIAHGTKFDSKLFQTLTKNEDYKPKNEIRHTGTVNHALEVIYVDTDAEGNIIEHDDINYIEHDGDSDDDN